MIEFSIKEYCEKYCKKVSGPDLNFVRKSSSDINSFTNEEFKLYDVVIEVGGEYYEFNFDIEFVLTHMLVTNDKFIGVIDTNYNVYGFLMKENYTPVPVKSSTLKPSKDLVVEDNYENSYTITNVEYKPITPEFLFLKKMFDNVFEKS